MSHTRAAALLAVGVVIAGVAAGIAGLARLAHASPTSSRPTAMALLPASRTAIDARLVRAPPAPGPSPSCPDGMALVEGSFCPRVEQTCLRWMDPPGRYHKYRCAEYARPASCRAPRVHERFCIDRRERSDPATGLPLNRQSWTSAKRACEAAGARVCKDSEWTFACEGDEMRPYPYGFARAASVCNADRFDLFAPASKPGRRRLRDEREPSGAHPACSSPFGVLDMAGNVAEWVSVDGYPEGSFVVQKGNWWQPGKQACRDEQRGHDRFYQGTETGFRCCAD
jgi:formylglycine-generating enzyme